jgi:hypothetical protein
MDDQSTGDQIAARRVRRIDVPPAIRTLSTLRSVGYADTFAVRPLDTGGRTPEEWARAILEDAPARVRAGLLGGWAGIGLKVLGQRSEDRVLGWRIRTGNPEFVLLGADSWIGMPGQLVIKVEHDALLVATLVEHDNLAARALWASVEPMHLRILSGLLDDFAGRHPYEGEASVGG